jgi:hypothetical protein
MPLWYIEQEGQREGGRVPLSRRFESASAGFRNLSYFYFSSCISISEADLSSSLADDRTHFCYARIEGHPCHLQIGANFAVLK